MSERSQTTEKGQRDRVEAAGTESLHPDDFSLIKTAKAYHPQLIVDEPTLRVVYTTPSHYFASEPKADVSVVLRNPKAMDSAKIR